MGLSKQKVRYHGLDEARGFAVLCMVFYHAFYTIGYNFSIDWGVTLFKFFTPAEPFFAMFFIGLSGAMCQFTRSNFKRGIKLALICVALTAVTVTVSRLGFEGSEIYFGVLHLLSAGMLLVALVNPVIKKCNPLLLAGVFLLLFILFYNVEFRIFGIGTGELSIRLPYTWYQNNALAFLGFHSASFYSADYFPLLPWIFMFLLGASLGLYNSRGKFPRFLIKQRVAPLGFLGRHALWVYILHQPVIFGLVFVIEWMTKQL